MREVDKGRGEGWKRGKEEKDWERAEMGDRGEMGEREERRRKREKGSKLTVRDEDVVLSLPLERQK
eukprot:1388860-Amorphochlora_amoeboformis.AAC.1